MADRTHNRSRTTPAGPTPSWHPGSDILAQKRDRLEQEKNLALAGHRARPPFADYPWGTTDPFGRLSAVGRAAMEQAEAGGVQAGAPPSRLELVGQRAVDYLLGLWAGGLFDGDCRGEVRVGVQDDRGERPVPRHLPDGLERTRDLRDDRVRDGV